MITVARTGLVYFAVVFLAGFLLALVRVPFLEPAVGVRWAELTEMPFMLLVIWWMAGRLRGRLPSRLAALGAGVFGLVCLLLVEGTVVLSLREMRLSDYMTERDPVAGIAYLVSLVLFALMPALRFRRAPGT